MDRVLRGLFFLQGRLQAMNNVLLQAMDRVLRIFLLISDLSQISTV